MPIKILSHPVNHNPQYLSIRTRKIAKQVSYENKLAKKYVSIDEWNLPVT